VIEALAAGTAQPIKQDKTQASKAPRLEKQLGLIDWSRPAIAIKNQVRALDPWPRAFTHWQRGAGEPLRLIVHRTDVVDGLSDGPPGQILQAGPKLMLATGAGVLELKAIQPAGKRVMAAGEFLRGYPVKKGDVFT